MLVEISERLCPPERVESVSDLSAQALYYYGKDDLKHRFIVICFLHQRQRKRETMEVERGQSVEYVEATVADYRLAHELPSDGVLDSTLDDLPRPARKLLDIIHEHVTQRADSEGVPAERIVFQRSEIRSASSWSFAQVKNDYLVKDPASSIVLPKKEHRLPRNVLAERQVAEVLQAMTPQGPTGLRDRAIVELLYGCGIRTTELCSLKAGMSTSRSKRSPSFAARAASLAWCRSVSMPASTWNGRMRAYHRRRCCR